MSAIDDSGLVTITPYRDGPYLVRGEFRIVDQEGNEIPLARRTIALCRCGKSRIRPFCDGTHRLAGFRAPGTADGPAARWRASRERGERRTPGRRALDRAARAEGPAHRAAVRRAARV